MTENPWECNQHPGCCCPLPENIHLYSWWRHQMETFSALLALCARPFLPGVRMRGGNSGLLQLYGFPSTKLREPILYVWWSNTGKLCQNLESFVLIWESFHQRIDSLWHSDTMATQNWINTGSGNGWLPDGTKPLPEPMLTRDFSHPSQRNFIENMQDMMTKISFMIIS